jgi:hypothetical protein
MIKDESHLDSATCFGFVEKATVFFHWTLTLKFSNRNHFCTLNNNNSSSYQMPNPNRSQKKGAFTNKP